MATAEKFETGCGRENCKSMGGAVSVTRTGCNAIGGQVDAVTTGGAAMPPNIRVFLDKLQDLKKLLEDLGEQYVSLAQARKRVRDGLSGLRSRPRITASEVEAFAIDVKLYEGKLLAIEVTARAISAKLNAAVAAMPKAGIKPAALLLAEAALDKSIRELSGCSVSIKTAETYLSNLKKTLSAARASAKSDLALTAVKTWAIAAYGKINNFKDIVLSPTELASWIDVAVKVFSDTRNVLEA